ncbi:MAG: ligase-associated DNA damage response endonuclease PdeM [Bacteroidota bacterium]
MTAPIPHIIQNNTFWLSPYRCIFWEEEQALILSDLHLGKTGHFRKHGIAVPQAIFIEDLQRLVEQLIHFRAKKIIAVGDLFHSKANKEMDLFLKWRNDLPGLEFILVRGNHDILEKEWYTNAAIQVEEGVYSIRDFSFLHDPAETPEERLDANFIFSGHLHPGVNIQGIAKQNLTFPCYHFSDKMAVLPAFSKFSGLAMVKKQKHETVYAIVNNTLVKIR